ncbi:MAG: hypothetical protein AAF828_08875 [Bacteroidota bacterium]
MKKYVALFLLFTFLSCSSKLHVEDEDGKEVHGIPFYRQKAVVDQTTQYLDHWLELSLVKKKEKEEIIKTVRIKPGQDLTELEKALEALDSSDGNKALVKAVLVEMDQLDQIDIYAVDASRVKPIGNQWKETVVVDYENVYYLNNRRALLGSSTITQKLAPNGTLSEFTATTDSQIDELATAVIGLATPLASIRVAKIASEASDASEVSNTLTKKMMEAIRSEKRDFDNTIDWANEYLDFSTQSNRKAAEEVKTEYNLISKEAGFVYTFTKRSGSKRSGVGVNLSPIQFDLNKYQFTRVPWTAGSPQSQTKKADDSVTIQAEIKLPKKEQAGG